MIQDLITQVWVKYTGRKLDLKQDQWLIGPIGQNSSGKINFDHQISKQPNCDELIIGLIDNLEIIISDTSNLSVLHPEIKAFYENTSLFQLQIKTKWRKSFQPIGWLIQKLFSKRLQQLHLPIGLTESEPIFSSLTTINAQPFGDAYTIWQRQLNKSKETIFSGLYGHTSLPNQTKVIKVVFPLPNGNATILLHAHIAQDGSWILQSDGKKFGDAGFYFTLKKGEEYFAKFVPAMHEKLHLQFIDNNRLKAQHDFSFWGITFLSMEYAIQRRD